MRRLVVLRHAKSAYPPGVVDHDRPLAPRGVADAQAAGRWLREHLGLPDHVVVSTARRARGTWTLAAGQLGYIGAAGYDADSPGPLTIDPRVYEAAPSTLLEVVRELPDRVGTAVLVGHNPGCESLVDLLAGERDAEAARLLAVKYPTSGIAVLEHDGPWPALERGGARLTAFAVPRG
ncbi:MAG: histidine phosphatase family protein [Candidatus Nanopelagicales bacterium]